MDAAGSAFGSSGIGFQKRHHGELEAEPLFLESHQSP